MPSTRRFPSSPLRLVRVFFYYCRILILITQSGPSLSERFALHRAASQRVKTAARDLGLKQIPLEDASAANGMSALYFPEGVSAPDLLPRLGKKGIVVAGGLLGPIKGIFPFACHAEFVADFFKIDTYFRIGHMGVSVVNEDRGDIEKVIAALGESLQEIWEEKGIKKTV